MKKTVFCIAVFMFAAVSAFAAPQDYAKFFEIDLDEPLPTLEELQTKYVKPNVVYDKHYDYGWNIGTVFDGVFRAVIANYGNAEKRMKGAYEDELLEVLSSVPKEMYEYIGPFLHQIPGLSDKVLNLPGIKETKNKFPSRIAPQLAHIENLEFLSPSLYFVLMPEVWPQSVKVFEMPNYLYSTPPKVTYNEKFYEALKVIVPPEKFIEGSGYKEKLGRSNLRTIDAGKNTLLTSADIQAFIGTLDDVHAFGQKDNNYLLFYNIGLMFDEYEKAHGKALLVNSMKDLVNPCARLVQKIKIAGKEKEREFAKIVGKGGFTVNSWAYTCDKTIKAARVANISVEMINSLKAYEIGIYNETVLQSGSRTSLMQFSTMQGVLEMYKAPLADVLEARKNRKALREQFLKTDQMLISSPVQDLD